MWGLRARIVLALAVVFALFILATELSISELVRVSMVRQSDSLDKTDPSISSTNRMAGHSDSSDKSDKAALSERPTGQGFVGLRRLILFYMVFGASIALLLGYVFVSRLVVRPLSQITQAVEKVAGGQLETQVPIQGSGELVRLGISFNSMTTKLREQRDELRTRLAELETSSRDLRASSRDLRAAQDGLIRSAKLASVGTLAAGVAHEIGNPLAGIIGLLDALEQGSTSEHGLDQKTEEKYRNLMRRELHRIDKIISDLLVYARPGQETVRQQDDTAPLKDILEHVRALLKAQKIFDKIQIIENIPDPSPTAKIARGDLTQIFINLFLNAAQAMGGEGQIEIRVALKKGRGTDSTDSERERVHISVKDTGPGIAAELESRIFEPFFSRRPKGDGVGLGLAICQSICEKAGGEIHLRPQSTSGAEFEIVLDARSC